MPVQTRRQHANTATTATTATAPVPLTREQKKQLREEMKKKEREDRHAAWAKKFLEGIHQSLRERTQIIIDNGYVNSPLFEFLREAKHKCEHFITLMRWYIIFTMGACRPSGSVNLSDIARTCRVPPAKHQDICIWFRKFMSFVAEQVTWIEHEGDTIVVWNNLHESVVKHFRIIFGRWDTYKDYFAQFPDCIEF